MEIFLTHSTVFSIYQVTHVKHIEKLEITIQELNIRIEEINRTVIDITSHKTRLSQVT